jgi:hypothetical protein
MAKILLAALLIATSALASGASCPDHDAGVDTRGDHAMGFSHEKTAHHFALTPSGGLIIATARDPNDHESRVAIVQHFQHIARAFKAGNFEMPMFIHERTPPGVPEMKRLALQIDYRVEETDAGGRVVVTTKSARALAAIHQFLKFQIADHRTGDSTAISQ